MIDTLPKSQQDKIYNNIKMRMLDQDEKPESEKHESPKRGSYQFDDVDLDDPKVWAAFCRGDCIGIFQVETELSRPWTKRLKPQSIQELSDVISLVRPGPLESHETEKYAKRKSNQEPITYLHRSLEPILNKTQGIICYQESCSKIVMELAGYTEGESNLFRKAISKKRPEEIAVCKKEFFERAEKAKVIDQKTAEEIFAIMQKFQRYGFCQAHGIEYAMNSYFSMYAKVYFPTEFYCSWLSFSGEKIDPKEEMAILVQDAKIHNIKVLPPDIRKLNTEFSIVADRTILFGLKNIRGIGGKAALAIKESEQTLQKFGGFIKSLKVLKRNVAESLIKSGGCDCFHMTRTEMLRYVYAISGRTDGGFGDDLAGTKPLSPVEYKFVMENIDQLGLIECLRAIIDQEICIKKRVPIIEAKIQYLSNIPKENNRQKAIWEKLYLGLNITCSAADDFDKEDKDTKSCREVLLLTKKSKVVMHVVLDSINLRKTGEKAKTPGQEYAYLDISDNTSIIKGVVCWPDKFAELKDQLVEGIVVTIYARKDNWKGKDQIVVDDLSVVG